MAEASNFPAEGACTCGAIRYAMETSPIFVHCCHCRWCQRETGGAFALNALIETDRVTIKKGKPEKVVVPSESGKGHTYLRCPSCKIALWSHYAGIGDKISFIRVGTLDDPDIAPPDIHIYTASKQPWLDLPHDTPSVRGYYKRSEYWSQDSIDRMDLVRKPTL